MKLLVCQGRPTYPFALGGAARITHRLLSTLALKSKHEVVWLGPSVHCDRMDHCIKNEGIRSLANIRTHEYRSNHLRLDIGYQAIAAQDLWSQYQEQLHQNTPTVVWAQQGQTDQFLQAARRRGVPSMLYLMDAEYDPEQVQSFADRGVTIVCLSAFIASHVQQRVGCHAETLYPIIDQEPLTRATEDLDRGRRDGYVLMINAYRQKGVNTFLTLAALLPDVRFMLQEAWPLSRQQLTWLRQQLTGLPNVTFQRTVMDMKPVYDGASMLLVPSLWQEGFGMVAVEAQAAGRPIIASRIGGLPESVGTGGMLISDHKNPVVWANAITALRDDPTAYAQLVHQGFESLRREEFSEQHVVDKFEQITNQMISH